MRRSIIVSLSAAALVAGVAVPSLGDTVVADRPFVDLNTIDGTPLGSLPCSGDGANGSGQTFLKVVQNAAPSATASSVAWAPVSPLPAGEAWGAGLPFLDMPSASELGTLMIDVYNGPTGVAAIRVVSHDKNSDAVRLWSGKSPIPGGPEGQWSTIDVSNAVYDWTEYDQNSFEPIASAGSSTLAAFAAAHPSSASLEYGYEPLIAFGCNGETFAVQRLQWGPAGGPATHVQELGTVHNDVDVALSAKFIQVGGTEKVSGSAQYGGAANATLSFKPGNTGVYATASRAASSQVINDLTCDIDTFICRNPFADAIQHPQYNTIYKWTYPAGNGVNAAASSFVMVHVQAKIIPTFPTSIARGHTFAVTGSIAPLRPGTKVSLLGRLGAGAVVQLGSASVSSAGTYKLLGQVTKPGSWSIWVQSPNDALNAAAKSPAKGYRIS